MGSPPKTLEIEKLADVIAATHHRIDNPSAFLALNSGNSYFTEPGIDGFVCYRTAGRSWIQFGGPFTAPDCRHRLGSAFLDAARRARRRVIAVQLQRDDAALYHSLGTTVNQLGASYAVDLNQFTLAGKKFVRLRNKISRAERAGLKVTEVDAALYGEAIDTIDRRWLRQKGRMTKELTFLIGEIGGPVQRLRRLFVGEIDNTPTAYISYSPVAGGRAGWLHDLSRRDPDAPPGVMEAINFFAAKAFQAQGAAWLHFGFTPFTSLDASHELPGAARIVSRIMRLLAEHGEVVYPARTQLEYKLKWAPQVIIPEYLAYTGSLSPGALWSLLRVTNSI